MTSRFFAASILSLFISITFFPTKIYILGFIFLLASSIFMAAALYYKYKDN